MSEIKGQLLGILLVLMVFAAVGAGVTAIVETMTQGINNEITEVIENNTSNT
jgi:Na+-translocating ferredoxin:NAD+ oxidoreductase RnfG subunit